jgi:hypothetical protein
MSEMGRDSRETERSRRDALLRFGRFAAVAPTTVVLLTGKAKAGGGNDQGQDNDYQGQNQQ